MVTWSGSGSQWEISFQSATIQLGPLLSKQQIRCPVIKTFFLKLFCRGLNQKYAHWKLRRTVEHIYFRIFTFLLIFLDIAFVIVELVKDCAGDDVSTIIRNLEVCLSVYFLVEVIFVYHIYMYISVLSGVHARGCLDTKSVLQQEILA